MLTVETITTLLLYFAGIMLAAIAALAGLVWAQLNNKIENLNIRLRTLGHEDRDIRNQINGVMTTLVEHLSNTENKQALEDENTRLKWMIKSIGKNND